MRLDWECVRAILTALEDMPEQEGRLAPSDVPGYAWPVVLYHVEVLAEAGLIKARCVRAVASDTVGFAQRLTFAGHELLGAMRQASMWNRIKARVRDAGMDLNIEAVKAAASALIKELLQ